jgi:FkbM family methyltransferase
MKHAVKRLLRQTPYRLIRATDANRFQAIDECLQSAKRRGYEPLVIIDAGANVGEFARLSRALFPDAVVHLIEPQPACLPALERLCARPGYVLHPYALGANRGAARLSIEPEGVTTGAYIAAEGVAVEREAEVELRTLDELGLELHASQRALLKLDLQGYELEALRGADTSLQSIECVLCEVSFFAQPGQPLIAEIISFLDDHGFKLYDIASITGRRRDNRARQADLLFARRGTPLTIDTGWA